jgi:MOSC domain-containing protein YiiM
VSLLADEVRREINGLLGLDLQPGDFNENILIAGLGDLGDLARGDVLLFSSGVVLCISEQNPPCAQLEAHGGAGLIKATSRRDEGGAIRNKRGIVATVVQTGRLSQGDTCSLRRHV